MELMHKKLTRDIILIHRHNNNIMRLKNKFNRHSHNNDLLDGNVLSITNKT